jgi:epsilon-lactone hydrolase
MTVATISVSSQGKQGIALIKGWLESQGALDTSPLALRRARHDAFAAGLPPIAGVRVTPSWLGTTRSLLIEPDNADGDLMFVHGGAYVLGSPESHLSLAVRYALASRMRVHAIAYRHAPEHPYPAAVNDMLTAWRALPPDSTILGTSAGGGIVLSAAVAMRDRGLPLLSRLIILIAPWIDLTLSGGSIERNAQCDIMLSRDGLCADAQAYCGTLDPRDARVSPLLADLSGLPPLFVQVGGNEILLDDSLRLEAKVAATGGICRCEVWEAMTHSWVAFHDHVPEADASIAEVGRTITRLGAWQSDAKTT